MAQKRAFYDPNTLVLKCWGFVSTNDAGDIVREVADNFDLQPGRWKLSGDTHEAVPEPAPRDEGDIDNANKLIRALCLYVGQQLGKSPEEIKTGIKQAFDALT